MFLQSGDLIVHVAGCRPQVLAQVFVFGGFQGDQEVVQEVTGPAIVLECEAGDVTVFLVDDGAVAVA